MLRVYSNVEIFIYSVFHFIPIDNFVNLVIQQGSSLILTIQAHMRSVDLVPISCPSYILSKSRFVSVSLFVAMSDFR